MAYCNADAHGQSRFRAATRGIVVSGSSSHLGMARDSRGSVRSDGLFRLVLAVVIGHQRHRRVTDLRFARGFASLQLVMPMRQRPTID